MIEEVKREKRQDERKRMMEAKANDRKNERQSNHHERKFPHLIAVDIVELSGLALAVVESTSTVSRSSVYLGGFFEEPCANRLCTSPEGLNRETAAICRKV